MVSSCQVSRSSHRAMWTTIRIRPVTVTKSMPWLSQRVIGFAGRRHATLLRTPTRCVLLHAQASLLAKRISASTGRLITSTIIERVTQGRSLVPAGSIAKSRCHCGPDNHRRERDEDLSCGDLRGAHQSSQPNDSLRAVARLAGQEHAEALTVFIQTAENGSMPYQTLVLGRRTDSHRYSR
jgi:hypothetical protein